MRTIIWFIYFWIYLIFIAPFTLFINAKIKKGQKPIALIESVVHNWASRLLSLAGVKVKVIGLENLPTSGALLVSNHQGNFDIPILLSQLDRPKSIVAKIELSKMPGISTWMQYFDCLFIDRGNARQSLQVMKDCQSLIDSGKQVIIFPEGTRSKGDTPGEFKAAALKAALKAECPIVPIAIGGSYRAMEAQGFWIKPTTVTLKVLPPIDTVGMEKERAHTLHEEIRAQIIEANKK